MLSDKFLHDQPLLPSSGNIIKILAPSRRVVGIWLLTPVAMATKFDTK